MAKATDFMDMIHDEKTVRVYFVDIINDRDVCQNMVEYEFPSDPLKHEWHEVYVKFMHDTDEYKLTTAKAYKRNCYELIVTRCI
jgi:hypothetical protein